MKKLLVIAALLGVGYYAFGAKKTTTASTPVVDPNTPLTIPQILEKYKGKIIQDANGLYMYVGSNKLFFDATPWQIYNYGIEHPEIEIVKLNQIVWTLSEQYGQYDGGLFSSNNIV